MSDLMTERITRSSAVCGGKACIAGHRVRVMDVAILSERMGMSPDDIVTQIPSINLSDVHAALAYYYDHIEEIREEIQNELDYVETFMREHPSALHQKLRQSGRAESGE